uniref:NADH dehydrogenase subunit 2 n=1 Tax=Sclerogryllus punctatus TaxID=2985483 RepID=UPI0022386770|nr:NADH dehydrogenase subunit 2 [Sclerogryllus punctatus]UYE92190.1 NADH dehydrogenase subunit 2 [Sclerogryllus punctatus]
MSTLNPSKLLFLIMLILGTLISISSNSWPATWMGLEINLMSFIPLMSKNNSLSNEASMKYFIIQAMASSLLITFIIMNFVMSFINQNIFDLIMSISLFMKMGAAPFHMWLPSVMEGLSWMNCIILMTWQKLAPFVISSFLNYKQSIFTITMILSIIIGSVGGLNQTSTRKIMAYSSINHIGWMIISLQMSENLWQLYFWIYSILTISVILILYNLSSQCMNQIPFSQNFTTLTKFMLAINMLSLGGLPPFLGFMPKWMVIQNSFYSLSSFIVLIMILCTLITLFYYIRLMISSFLINSNLLKWNASLMTTNNTLLISLTSSLSLFTLPMYPLMFYMI